jgi:hypothetical protein
MMANWDSITGYMETILERSIKRGKLGTVLSLGQTEKKKNNK